MGKKIIEKKIKIQFIEIIELIKDSRATALKYVWTNNLLILSKAKTEEEREFYIRISIKEKYSSRELERQIDSGFYERSVLSDQKLSALTRDLKPRVLDTFKDTYILDFYLEALDRDVKKRHELFAQEKERRE